MKKWSLGKKRTMKKKKKFEIAYNNTMEPTTQNLDNLAPQYSLGVEDVTEINDSPARVLCVHH